MLDADLERFATGLNQTKPGLRLRMAVHEGHIAIAQIRRFLPEQALALRERRALESWRQAWIQASNNAAQAIDELWDVHHWPADGARVRGFQWQPAKDFRR